MQNFYSLLTAFSIFLQTKKSSKSRAADGYLAKATALGYFSQVVNLLRERYSDSLQDSKLDHLVVHADAATGLKNIHDGALLTMMWHTFGRAIDTCFARKQQLSVAASGVSIYKSAERWEQCMLHAFGMLFVCYDEPSEYLFPLVPRYAVSEFPGSQTYTQEEAPFKHERKRPNIAGYEVTPNMTSHSLRREAAAYANASPKLAIQWISTRGAWLLDSLTKAFAY
ncbi:uncharacterized protein PITG_23348 [Phytophthora infestans T30-4]|uniref:Uncharacterized protein n=1 Tax=Phytophthora infestans (strain T30-4) TaxID=403677 RepID=D0P2F4_PHYIT|nr:uncharacterized protein PITG_23348 [Phytophthora infestans T30-4]EEY56245.1 hypothetical protein PITG_23348 [Phytophthora infestans T30-4]|eukprot:XP_002895521.1 hypothetical protein PITG_23348 [Phytophthora infestans T30-4]